MYDPRWMTVELCLRGQRVLQDVLPGLAVSHKRQQRMQRNNPSTNSYPCNLLCMDNTLYNFFIRNYLGFIPSSSIEIWGKTNHCITDLLFVLDP
jgi:hypothetical protein